MEKICSVEKDIAQVIMMLVLINMVLIVEHCQDFRKIKVVLMKQILMDVCSSILYTDQVEDLQMMKDKLVDGKVLQVGLKVKQLRSLKILVVNLIII